MQSTRFRHLSAHKLVIIVITICIWSSFGFVDQAIASASQTCLNLFKGSISYQPELRLMPGFVAYFGKQRLFLSPQDSAKLVQTYVWREDGASLQTSVWAKHLGKNVGQTTLYRGMRLSYIELRSIMDSGLSVSRTTGEVDLSPDATIAIDYAFHAGFGHYESAEPKLGVLFEIDRRQIPFRLSEDGWVIRSYQTIPADDPNFPFTVVAER